VGAGTGSCHLSVSPGRRVGVALAVVASSAARTTAAVWADGRRDRVAAVNGLSVHSHRFPSTTRWRRRTLAGNDSTLCSPRKGKMPADPEQTAVLRELHEEFAWKVNAAVAS
jgi:hypothetical protein